ncbi:MAG: diphosphomevalonate decarboxylase [Bradymonadia bacterium]
MPSLRTVTARAGVNIALVKYWGKRDTNENLPAVGSISMTLRDLFTQTSISVSEDESDHFELNGKSTSDQRVFTILDQIRQRANVTEKVRIKSENFVPTASGLASSASGSAALVTGAWKFFTGQDDWHPVLDLVRKASGSAPRSLLGGLVELHKESGKLTQLSTPEAWPLTMVVAQLSEHKKTTSSRRGMAHTKATSSYYDAWVNAHPADLQDARHAISKRDIEALGTTMERSTMRMHACMLAASPPLLYWNSKTIAIWHLMKELRANGTGAWCTMDAGPHVKVLCLPDDAPVVHQAIENTMLSYRTTIDAMGAGVCLR